MPRRLIGTLCLFAVACGGLAGCASTGFGLKPFSRSAQWEPEVEDAKPSDWRSGVSNMRKDSDKKSSEDPLDKLIFSDTARDISRSLGGNL